MGPPQCSGCGGKWPVVGGGLCGVCRTLDRISAVVRGPQTPPQAEGEVLRRLQGWVSELLDLGELNRGVVPNPLGRVVEEETGEEPDPPAAPPPPSGVPPPGGLLTTPKVLPAVPPASLAASLSATEGLGGTPPKEEVEKVEPASSRASGPRPRSTKKRKKSASSKKARKRSRRTRSRSRRRAKREAERDHSQEGLASPVQPLWTQRLKDLAL